MALNVTREMIDKLSGVGDAPLKDSIFGKNSDGTSYEQVQGGNGYYLSSEVDGWLLHGPFEGLL
jgi:hypothetical protein